MAWLVTNHPTDIPDELLGEYNGELDHARSDTFQPFENDQTFGDESLKELNNPTGESAKSIAGEEKSSVVLLSVNEEASPSSSQVQNEPLSASDLIAEQLPKTLNVTPPMDKTHSYSVKSLASTHG